MSKQRQFAGPMVAGATPVESPEESDPVEKPETDVAKDPAVEVAKAEPLDEMAAIDQEVALADALVAEARARLSDAQRAAQRAQESRDKLVALREAARPVHENQLAISAYLAKQKEIRAEKADRQRQILAAGIDFSQLRTKAPIDQAMARKAGFGLGRPQVPVNGNRS